MRILDWKWLAIPGAAIAVTALGMIPMGAKAQRPADFSMIEEHGVAVFDMAQVPASEAPSAKQAAVAPVATPAPVVTVSAPAPMAAAAMQIPAPVMPEPPAIVAPLIEVSPDAIPAPAMPAAVDASMRQRRDDDDFDMPVHQEETIQKTFTMAAGSAHKSLVIDNVWGSIEVKAIDGDQVQLVANKTMRAETQAKLDQAKKDVTLDITDQPDLVKLYVNGPFRCDCNDCSGVHIHSDDPGYVVRMDFQLQVPRNIDIDLKTVNSGEINVSGVNGTYAVRNVNGSIEMTDIAGSGSARTVNGHVKVSFREAPKENSSFGTVNGAVNLAFPKTLSADFRFKTFNGGIYTDFPVTALPVRAVEEQHEGGKVIFRADRYTGGRIGSGGPEIRIDTLNGDIAIHSRP